MTQAQPASPSSPATTAQAPAANVIPASALTPRDIAALKARKSELSGLLNNVTERRKEVQNLLRTATTPADKGGLEQRLAYLDGRITRIEADIDQNSTQLASFEAQRAQVNTPSSNGGGSSRNRGDDAFVPVAVCFVLFVLSPLALTFSRAIWKRTTHPRAAATPENNDRLIRMEQAIDSIAIEVERVSEGQRFVTRLLADKPTPLGASVGEPVGVGEVRRSS